MNRTLLATAFVAAVATMAGPAVSQELRIGYLATFSGGAAMVGEEMKRGWELGLEHEGWHENGDELGGVATTVYYGDDQRKPDVALQVVNRWLRSDRVHVIAGFPWSHVLLATIPQITRNRAIAMSTVAGPSELAGRQCSRYFISTAWQNDQTPEALGQLMNSDNLDSVYLLAPNYQAGKQILAGFRRSFGGEVAGQTLFPLGTRDFQAEFARIREAGPSAVMIFAPGGMGPTFFSQWASSGLADRIRIYSVYTVNWMTMPVVGEDALGSYQANFWAWDSEVPAAQRFVRDYVARHGRPPSLFAAQAYDAPGLIASGVRHVGGNVDDTVALNAAMRLADFESVRGPYRYNVNGFPIQNFYRREIVQGPDGPTIRTTGTIFTDHADHYADQCPEREHLN